MKPLFTQLLLIILLIVLVSMSGCAQLPLANYGQDALMKTFPDPASDSAGLYVFRDSANSGLLTKRLTLNGEVLGDSGMFVYYYKTLEPGTHTLSTQSEFGEHTITFDALAGKNTYIRQKIVRGVFIAGAELEEVNEREGKIGVSKCYLVHEGVLHEAIETKAPF